MDLNEFAEMAKQADRLNEWKKVTGTPAEQLARQARELDRQMRPIRDLERAFGMPLHRIEAMLSESQQMEEALKASARQKEAFAFRSPFLGADFSGIAGGKTLASIAGELRAALVPPRATIEALTASGRLQAEAAKFVANLEPIQVQLARQMTELDRGLFRAINSVAGHELQSSVAAFLQSMVKTQRDFDRALVPWTRTFVSDMGREAFAPLQTAPSSTPVPDTTPPDSAPLITEADLDFMENDNRYVSMQMVGPATEGALRLEFHRLLTKKVGPNWPESLLAPQRAVTLKDRQAQAAARDKPAPLYRFVLLADMVDIVQNKQTWKAVRELFTATRMVVLKALIEIKEPRHDGVHNSYGLTHDEAVRAIARARFIAHEIGSEWLMEKADAAERALFEETSSPTLH